MSGKVVLATASRAARERVAVSSKRTRRKSVLKVSLITVLMGKKAERSSVDKSLG